jgi:hypothetical protein
MTAPRTDNVNADKFVYFHDGNFHPVTNMYDRDGDPVADSMRCARAVVYLAPDEWLAAPVFPGEIELRETVEARLKTVLRRAP